MSLYALSFRFCSSVSDKPTTKKGSRKRPIGFKAIKCFYRGCKRPEIVEGPSALGERPSDAKFWSDPATWENGLPQDDSVVTIKGGKTFCCHAKLKFFLT